MSRLFGKTVVVTGGASGIGKATSLLASKEGASIAVCDIMKTDGEKVVDEITRSGGRAEYFQLNVSRESEVKAVFESIFTKIGPVNGLVNNAGITGLSIPTHELDEVEWDRIFDVNVKGVFFCTKHTILQMLKNGGGGSIVNVSSVAGMIGGASPPYSASKAAVRIMTKTDAAGYAKYNIRVNSVHPGVTDTPLIRNLVKARGEESTYYEKLESKLPFGRLARPEEIASVIVFLLSNDASYVSGEEVMITGASSLSH